MDCGSKTFFPASLFFRPNRSGQRRFPLLLELHSEGVSRGSRILCSGGGRQACQEYFRKYTGAF